MANTDDELEQFVKMQEANQAKTAQQTAERKKTAQERLEEQAKENLKKNEVPLEQAIKEKTAENQAVLHEKHLGFLPLDVDSLPSKGLFYRDGFKLFIRAASGAEMRHWSMMDEDDFNSIYDSLNYILERCTNVSYDSGKPGSWRDIVEVDRLYIILAIRDFTFDNGTNDLKIKITEDQSVVVDKDKISFMKLPEKVMKNNYDEEKKCFVFKTHNPKRPELNLYMPTVGLGAWLKDYITKKERTKEGYDKDFANIAGVLIKDHRGLNDTSYEKFMTSTMDLGIYEYSIISKMKDVLAKSIEPEMSYVNEDGAELTAPLVFRGGYKAFFTLDLDDMFDE